MIILGNSSFVKAYDESEKIEDVNEDFITKT